MYALFYNGKQLSKAHSTKDAAMIEAFERRIVIDGSPDFIGDKGFRTFAGGFEIKEIDNTKREE